MADIQYKLTTDNSQFLQGVVQADNAQKDLSTGAKEFEKDSKKAFDEAGKGSKKYGDEASKNIEKQKSLKAELRDLVQQQQRATDPKEYERLTRAVGALKDQIGDAADAANIFATDSPFEAVGNSIGSVASKLRNLDFKGAADQSKLMVSATKQITFKEALGGIKDLGTTLLNVGKSLLANPIFLIGAAVTLIITNFDKLSNAGGLVGEVFKGIGSAISLVLDYGEKFLNFIGLIDSTKISFEDFQKNNNALMESVSLKYDLEISKAKKAGKDVAQFEKEKTQNILKQLDLQTTAAKKAYDKREIDMDKYNEKIVEIGKERWKAEITLNNLEAEDNKKALDKKKALQEAYKKNQEALAAALLDIQKRSEKAEIDGLTGVEKLNAQKALSEKELAELKSAIQKKGELTNKNFKFNAEQEQEFGNLKTAINREYYNGVLQLAIQSSTKEAQINKSKVDGELANLELRNQIAVNNINAVKAIDGANENEKLVVEEQRKKVLLEVEKQYNIDKLDLVVKQINAEKDVKSNSLIAELDIVSKKEDAISKARAESIKKELTDIGANSALQVKAAQSVTNNIIAGIDESLKQAKPKQINFAKLLGLDNQEIAVFLNTKINTKINEDDVAKAKQAINQLSDILNQFLSAYFDAEQQKFDKELDNNQKLIDSRDKNISNLQSSLEDEKKLQDKGLANNVDRINQAIKEQEDARKKDLENEKRIKEEKAKLAKQQFILETTQQGISLVTASANIFSTYSQIPIVGIPLAIGVISAMFAAFAGAKAQAFAALESNKGGSFYKGGYTGDGGKYEEAGTVHKGEFVTDKETTSRNRTLLEGLHTNDTRLIQIGISDLLKNTGVSLPNLAKDLNVSKSNLKQAEMNAYFNADNSAMEAKLANVESILNKIHKQGNDDSTVLPNGTRIIKKGNLTTVIRIKDHDK